jgi:hypothetical protein
VDEELLRFFGPPSDLILTEVFMKKRFADDKIVRIIGESRAIGAPAAAKKFGASTHTLDVWRRKFAGLEVRQVAELKRLKM